MTATLCRRPSLFRLLLCGAAALAGGGGAADNPDGFQRIDFGPNDPAEDIPYQRDLARENAAQGLTFEPEKLAQVNVIYGNPVRPERVNRDMIKLLEVTNPGEIRSGLGHPGASGGGYADWLFEEVISYQLPEGQVEAFGDYYVQALETVQLDSYGAGRLLAAAALVGPDGRSLLNFTDQERDRFDFLGSVWFIMAGIFELLRRLF